MHPAPLTVNLYPYSLNPSLSGAIFFVSWSLLSPLNLGQESGLVAQLTVYFSFFCFWVWDNEFLIIKGIRFTQLHHDMYIQTGPDPAYDNKWH